MKYILQVLSGHNSFTGVASYLYQQYKYVDKERVHYDFLLCKENSMELVMDDEIFKESKFYVLNARTKRTHSTDYLKVMTELNKILDNNHYDAVVVNTSIVAIISACMQVVKRHPNVKFIPHAHNTELVLPKGAFRRKIAPFVKTADKFLRKKIMKNAYALFACSEEAGITTFGAECVNMDNFIVIRDAIDLNHFIHDAESSENIRKELGIDSHALVVGNVGTLCKRKNQTFLLQIFSRIKEQHPNSNLLLIGDGEDRNKLESLVKSMGLEGSVLFLGQKKNVSDYYNVMDLFAFTTLSEGLGIVAIEAQAAGLPTIVSDGVPDDVLLTPLAEKISLKEDAETWATHAIELYKKYPDHNDYSTNLVDAGYDIPTEAKKITEFYCAF